MTAIFGTIVDHPAFSGMLVGVWFSKNRSFLVTAPSSRESAVQAFSESEELNQDHLNLLQYVQFPTGIENGCDSYGWDSITYDLSREIASILLKSVAFDSRMSSALELLKPRKSHYCEPDEMVRVNLTGVTFLRCEKCGTCWDHEATP